MDAVKKILPADKQLKGRKIYSLEMLQKRQKRLLADGGGTPNILPKLNANLSKTDILNSLRKMIGTKCVTNAEKFHLLRRRDELMSKLRELNAQLGTQKITQGTCTDMCPESERYMREVKKSIHFYECDPKGQMIHAKMVKDYSRSAADQDMPLAHELRSLEALQATMDYLIFRIGNEMPKTNVELTRWYDFLWSRTRAIRKDITQQMLQTQLAVDLVEKCARLHIFASFKLSFLDAELFDHKMNTENLSKSMQTLRHMYEDLAKKKEYCKNESEFRSYDILLNLTDFNVHNQVLAYRPEIRESPQVQLALNLASALQNNNYVRFFRLVRKQASFLQSCLCFQFFSFLRQTALKIICQAYHMFPFEKFIEILAFDSKQQALTFLKAMRIDLDAAEPNFINTREGKNLFMPGGDAPNPNSVPQLGCEWIDSKAIGITLPQILYNDPFASPAKTMPDDEASKLVNSFDTASNTYMNDPVLHDVMESHDITIAQMKPSTNFVAQPKSQTIPTISVSSGFSFARALQQLQPKCNGIKDKDIGYLPGNQKTMAEKLMDRVTSAQLKLIADRISQDVYIQSKLTQIRARLNRERIRLFLRHWISFTRKKRAQMVENVIEDIMDHIINRKLEEISRRIYMDARKYQCQKLAIEISHLQGNVLFEKVLSDQLHSIAFRIRASQVRNIQERLEQIRQNLHQKWLRQFTGHWLSIVRRNRLLRAITLLPSTTNNESEDRFSYSAKRFFHPGIKKITPEMMQQMAEQKIRQREEAAKRAQEEKEKMMQVEDDEQQLPPAHLQIRNLILDGISFSEGLPSEGFANASTSNLRLYKPGVKQITPECMQRMVEQKRVKRQNCQKHYAFNGETIANGYTEEDEENEDGNHKDDFIGPSQKRMRYF